jgi:hypothetical protein
MMRGPRFGQKSGVDFVAIARAAWGDAIPDWVLALAEEAKATSGVLVAERIGYSPAVVTHVLRNHYRGDMERVAEKVRGALMGVTVCCPVLGEIGKDRCLDEQKKPFAGTSSVRSRLHRACRAGCPNSRLTIREN